MPASPDVGIQSAPSSSSSSSSASGPLLRASDGGSDASSQRLGDLDRKGADASGTAVHEKGLTLLQPAELTVLASLSPSLRADVREHAIGVKLGRKGVIPLSDPPDASSGPDIALDENRLEELIIEAQTALPVELPALANRCASSLGLDTALIYLVDLQQQLLIPLDEALEPLPVDRSSAGWAYRTVVPRVDEADDGLILWMPLVDGAERLGVLAIRTASLDGVRMRRSRILAHLFAMLITSKRAYSDWLAARTRTATMRLPAEMLRAFLPPRTIGSSRCVSTAVLEPAYNIAGDAFDHSVAKNILHTMILDAMGHDLTAGLTTSVAMAAARNARRAGADLADVVNSVDQALTRWLPDHFSTGVLCRLDAETGRLRWVNCGHPHRC